MQSCKGPPRIARWADGATLSMGSRARAWGGPNWRRSGWGGSSRGSGRSAPRQEQSCENARCVATAEVSASGRGMGNWAMRGYTIRVLGRAEDTINGRPGVAHDMRGAFDESGIQSGSHIVHCGWRATAATTAAATARNVSEMTSTLANHARGEIVVGDIDAPFQMGFVTVQPTK